MSTADALLRLLPALAILLGALWAAKRVSRRSGGTSTVRNRTALTRSASLVTVEVDERLLVLGVTDHQINVVAELLSDADLSALTPRPDPATDTPYDATQERTPPRPASIPRPRTGLIANLRWVTSRASLDDLPGSLSQGGAGPVRRAAG